MSSIKHNVTLNSDRKENLKQFDHIPDNYQGIFTYELNLIFYIRDSYMYDLKKLATFAGVEIEITEKRGWIRSMIFVKLEGDKKNLIEMFDQIVALHERLSGHMLTLVNDGK